MLSQSQTCRLQFQHQTVSDLIEGRSEEQLRLRAIPDKWSVFENLAHLVSYQPVFQLRISRILTESNPSFDRYIADTDPAFEACTQKPLEQLVQNLALVRNEIWQTIRALREDELSRVATHPKFGLLDIVQWTDFFLLHEAHHLFTMFQLLKLRG